MNDQRNTETAAQIPKIDQAWLDRLAAINYDHARQILNIKARQLRHLIRTGKLERVGEGHHRKVTVASVKQYAGLVEKSGTERR